MHGGSFIKDGTFLFVSKSRNLSVVLDGGSQQVLNGRLITQKPYFADFLPGPLGGEFRTKKEDVAQLLREHNSSSQKQFVELKSDDDVTNWVRENELDKNSKDDRIVRKGQAKAAAEPIEEPEPETVPAATPRAAKGPGRWPAKSS